MDPKATIHFSNMQWPKLSLPTNVVKDVRKSFLFDNDGNMFKHNDLKDILKSWLHDEFNVCPIDFDFQIEL